MLKNRQNASKARIELSKEPGMERTKTYLREVRIKSRDGQYL